MKNIVRAFVVVLALTGAAAATHTSVNSAVNSPAITVSKATAFPIPTCPLDDPNGCGIVPPSSAQK